MLNDKISILDFIDSDKGKNLSQRNIVAHFRQNGFPSITQSSISRLITNSSELRDRAKDTAQLFYKRPQKVIFPQVEQSLACWVQQALARKVKLTAELIKKKARHFADLHGVPKDQF